MMAFGISINAKSRVYFLNSLNVSNHLEHIIYSIQTEMQQTNRTDEVHLTPTQIIVGARVQTEGKFFPVALSFKVFDTAKVLELEEPETEPVEPETDEPTQAENRLIEE
jgi:hypothetical protein